MLTLTNMVNVEVPVVLRMLRMNSRACESEASASLTLKVLLLKISGLHLWVPRTPCSARHKQSKCLQCCATSDPLQAVWGWGHISCLGQFLFVCLFV